ncbi:hypothetical protein OAP03_02025 [Gammaproteobacteria bacterium]|nr:hypothetical protein [Gammaproteobacteria bacterium]MDC0577063.1 hypothetical protein [Gammaproteobacteria bacterium]
MKKIFMLLGCIITGLYAALYILVGMLAMIGSIFSEGVRVNIQDMFLSLSTEGVVGFLVITQVTIVPLIAGWISKLLYKKYKSLK